jgi:hypothetical protein
VTDESLLSLVAACPGLKRLNLPHNTLNKSLPFVTLNGIHAALQGAPFMEELTLRFDATNVPADTVSPSSSSSARSVWVPQGSGELSENRAPRSTSPLKYIDVCTSPLGSSTAFRGWLSKHHPLVKGLDYFAPLHTAMDIIYHPSARGNLFQGRNFDKMQLLDSHLYHGMMFERWNDVCAFVLGGRK